MYIPTLEEAKPVAQGSVIPVSFRNIKGASGIETGVIEVLNANTGETYSATEIGLRATGGLGCTVRYSRA